jgi:hypothetical protein
VRRAGRCIGVEPARRCSKVALEARAVEVNTKIVEMRTAAYIDSVDLRVECDDAVVAERDWSIWTLKPSVCNGYNIFHLIMRESESSNRPLIQVGLSIIDSDLSLRYDPEVVASAAESPE